MGIDLKVLVRSFNCESRACYTHVTIYRDTHTQSPWKFQVATQHIASTPNTLVGPFAILGFLPVHLAIRFTGLIPFHLRCVMQEVFSAYQIE